MERFAIVGFGCAGYHALRAVREAGCDAAIDVYSDTALPPYNPMLTTYYVKGAVPYDALFPFGDLEQIRRAWDFTLIPDCRVAAVDTASMTVRRPDGTAAAYDKILLATGARAISPPVGSVPDERIYSMRCVDDAVRLKKALDERAFRRVLVIGASMVGIKLVELLHERGTEIILSDLAEHIFPTAAFEETSERIEAFLRDRGVELRFGVKTADGAERDGEALITFTDGSSARVDAVINCIGTRASLDCLTPGQVSVGRGVRVDDHMRTSVEGLYAAGDCCEGNDLSVGSPRIIGLWSNAAMQGETAGKNMAGQDAAYPGTLLHNITHFMDMDFVSFGDRTLPGEREVLLDGGGRFAEVSVLDGRVQCVNLLNLYRDSGVVKNYLLRSLAEHEKPLDVQMQAALLKSGLPKKLTALLEGGGAG